MTVLRDKTGREIKEFDVIKMFHFVGARNKRHYMYKWVIAKDDRLYGHHLGRKGDKDAFMLSQDLLQDTEIVQGLGGHGHDDFDDRPRVKDPTPEIGQG